MAAHGVSEQLIPIDIHYSKLLDWLVDRRHCELRWAADVKGIRSKLQEEVKSIPSSMAISKTMKNASIAHYFHILEVVEELKRSEEDGATNIFGQYSSQRMKNWQEILKLYKKQNVYLAESAQILARNVSYEIPALKRQIAKATQQQQDCDRREEEHLSTAKTCKETYKKKCRELGVEGENPKAELLKLADFLPQTLKEILTEAQQALPAVVDFYLKFAAYLKGSEAVGDQLSSLRRLLDEGNISAHQWTTGEIPQQVASNPALDLSCPQQQLENQSEEIDWGDMDVVTAHNEEDCMLPEDLGISLEEGGGTFNIIVENEGEESQTQIGSSDQSGIDVGPELSPPPSQQQPPLISVLESNEIRNQILDDLNELEAFLSRRILERSMEETEVVNVQQLDSTEGSSLLAEERLSALEEWSKTVGSLLQALTSQKMTQLFLIRTSPTYVDRVVEKLRFHLRQGSKAGASAGESAQRRQEAVSLQAQSAPLLEKIVGETKELQSQVAMEISKRYNDRTVNIMGEINLI